ncbi:hypothetical protein IWX50DRAFT_984 [Phyllosticta citricarpa]
MASIIDGIQHSPSSPLLPDMFSTTTQNPSLPSTVTSQPTPAQPMSQSHTPQPNRLAHPPSRGHNPREALFPPARRRPACTRTRDECATQPLHASISCHTYILSSVPMCVVVVHPSATATTSSHSCLPACLPALAPPPPPHARCGDRWSFYLVGFAGSLDCVFSWSAFLSMVLFPLQALLFCLLLDSVLP